jgi:hypothetical protein
MDRLRSLVACSGSPLLPKPPEPRIIAPLRSGLQHFRFGYFVVAHLLLSPPGVFGVKKSHDAEDRTDI